MHFSARPIAALLAGLLVLAGCSSNTGTVTVNDIAPQSESAQVESDAVESAATPLVEPTATAVPAPTEVPAVEVDPDPIADEESDPDPEAAVIAAFDAYQQALVDRDGPAAFELVTPSTIDYYDRILDFGLNATSDDLLTSISLSDGLGVLAMRARVGQDLLLFASGRELFDAGVEQGLVGDAVGATVLDRVEIDGPEAFGVIQGIPGFRFQLVDGTWRVDLPYSTALIDENEVEFLAGVGGDGTTREELYNLVALGYQTTFAELGAPIGG